VVGERYAQLEWKREHPLTSPYAWPHGPHPVPRHLRHASSHAAGGQKPRPVHESPTSRSSLQCPHAKRTAPSASTPHLRELRSFSTTKLGIGSPSSSRRARRVSSCSRTTRCTLVCCGSCGEQSSCARRVCSAGRGGTPRRQASADTVFEAQNLGENARQLAGWRRAGGGWRPVIAIPAREQRLSIEPARVEVEPWCSHPRARDHDGLKDKASSRSKGGSRSPLRAKSPRISSARRARQRPSRAVLRREPLAAQVRSGYHSFPDQEPHPAHLGHQHQQELARRRPRAWARDQGARTAPHVANVAIVRGLPPTWTR
jgi:hypothetical protein